MSAEGADARRAPDREGEVAPSSSRKSKDKEKVVERAVIDEQLITDAIKKDRASAEEQLAARLDDEEPIDMRALTSLTLSFENIAKIDNLRGFEQLVKLQLDNNAITRIENLDHLVNLRWLDLSFNKITSVDGLSSLTQLTDLSLFNNEIEEIDNLDALKNLQVLSIGNNKIKDLESIKRLRQFPRLKCLNLKGNPVCQLDDYQVTVFAFVNNLAFLDYEMVEPSQKQKARDRLLDQLVEIEADEKILKQITVDEQKQQEQRVLHEAANLHGVQAFFDQILREDTEFGKLKPLPGFGKILNDYRDLFERTLAEFIDTVLLRQKDKETETALYEEAWKLAVSTNEQKCIGLLQTYDAKQKRVFRLVEEGVAGGNRDPAILVDLRNDLDKLGDDLMDAEMLVVEQIGQIIGEFETAYTALATANVNKIQNTFRALEDVANSYDEALTELADRLLAQYQGDDGAAPPDDAEIAAVLTDKEALKNAVTTSHDNHLNRIVAKQDDLADRENKSTRAKIKQYKDSEYQRNRHRVAEIWDVVEANRQMVQDRIDKMSSDESDRS